MTASLDVQVVHGVAEIGQEAWDRMASDRPFSSYRWYCFGEKVISYAQPIYAILGWRGEPVARATFWLTGDELLPVEPAIVRRGLQAVLKHWPLLMCQAPLSSAASSGLILPEGPLRDVALATIVEVAEQLVHEHRASFFMFPYLTAAARQEGWPTRCLWTNMAEPGTRLAITWADLTGYLHHLSKKRRYNLRRMCRLADELGVEVKRYSQVMDVDEALRLHDSVNRRHGSATEPWMRAAFENAGMVDTVWLAAEVDGRLVGCELMLGDRGTWFVTGLGLDYSVPYVYYMLSYADIQYAIESGAHTLRWGSGAYDVKRRLGFEVEQTSWVAFGARARWLQRLGTRLAAVAAAQPDSDDREGE